MKIFLDTANLKAIKEWKETGLIDGVTTNPTHLSTEGKDPVAQVKAIAKLLPKGAISVEVTEKKPEAVYKQAKAISKLAKNIVVKIPCHRDYYSVIAKLVKEGVKLNITLVFTVMQALMMAKLGVEYVSPFVGRWDDIDADGSDLLYTIRHMLDEYGFETQLLAASIRGVPHFHEAIMAGADVITVPIEILEKASHHVLTDQGIAKFDRDWKKLGVRKFP
jgi:transaldolase